MTDAELRTLVRDAIARHLRQDLPVAPPRQLGSTHPSLGVFPMLRGGDGDGACLIEPAVPCNHCGYCLSYGH